VPLGRADPCSVYLAGCDACVAHVGCGWCSWGQGSCQSGGLGGPTSSVCYESGSAQRNWYYGTCSDQCYLVCGITCSSSQTCIVNREVEGPPQCSCQTKAGIIIAAVVGSIFCFCLTLTIFVYVRRRNALKYSRSQNAQLSYNNGPSAYAVLPGGQPAYVVGYAPAFPQQGVYTSGGPTTNGGGSTSRQMSTQ
jgi:hypothetical protein